MSRNNKRRKSRRGCATVLVLLIAVFSVLAVFLYNTVSAGGFANISGDIYRAKKSSESGVHSGNLILVNSSYAFDFNESQRIVSLAQKKNGSYKLRDDDMSLAAVTVSAFNRMLSAFEKETGINDICINSAFRDYESQESIFNDRVNTYGYSGALAWASQPGYSEHHTGLAADIVIMDDNGDIDSFYGQGDYSWIIENMHSYGFVLRYEESKTYITGIANEPWHFRYVGIPHATYMYENGLCLEEYLTLLRSYTCEGEHLSVEANGARYEMYYCPMGSLYVPLLKLSEVSGNNTDGYIVAVRG